MTPQRRLPVKDYAMPRPTGSESRTEEVCPGDLGDGTFDRVAAAGPVGVGRGRAGR